MPRNIPRTDFATRNCVAGLEPLKAQKSSHSHRMSVRATRVHNPKTTPNRSTGRHTANLMSAGSRYVAPSRKTLSKEEAQQLLADALRG